MNSISFDVVKSMIHQKKYDAITEFAHVEFPDKGELVVTEYTGTGVRVYKDSEDRTRILCPKEMDVIQEGTVANEIANGTIFDDADEVDNNAEMIEKTSIPYSAMINSGKDVPKKLKPMIAIVIGRIDDGEEFSVSDNDRITGNNFVRDLVCCKDKGTTVPAVVDDYLGKDKDAFHTPEMGRDVADLDKEISDINDIKTEDIVTDDDTVDEYDDTDKIDIESMEDSVKESDDKEKDSDDDEKKENDNDDDNDKYDEKEDDDDSDDSDEEDEANDETDEEEPKTTQENFVQEAKLEEDVKVLKHFDYDPKTKTIVTDIPIPGTKTGEKRRVKVKLVKRGTGTGMNTKKGILYLDLADFEGMSEAAMVEVKKHEEGHLAIETNPEEYKKLLGITRRLVEKNKALLSGNGHSMSPTEYFADIYSALHSGYKGAGIKEACEKTKAEYIKIYKKSTRAYDETIEKHLKLQKAIDDNSNIGKIYNDCKNSNKTLGKVVDGMINAVTSIMNMFAKKNISRVTSSRATSLLYAKHGFHDELFESTDKNKKMFEKVNEITRAAEKEIDEEFNKFSKNNTNVDTSGLKKVTSEYLNTLQFAKKRVLQSLKSAITEMELRCKFVDAYVAAYMTESYDIPESLCASNTTYQEGFLSKKPKKLKPIPRDVVAYITVEMNAIRSSNDQAMLSGYTCSKIELVDFYLTVLDTQDPRYIVPHTKQYLETMKRDLENLLTQILGIRPINRGDKIWRVNVNYPEGRM